MTTSPDEARKIVNAIIELLPNDGGDALTVLAMTMSGISHAEQFTDDSVIAGLREVMEAHAARLGKTILSEQTKTYTVSAMALNDDDDDDVSQLGAGMVAIDINVDYASCGDDTFAMRVVMTGFPTLQLAQTFGDVVKEAFEKKLLQPIPMRPLG
jgi:hypothetical protein